eukprot:15464917-Alexandrium_andersonii.AAC.1
MISGSDPPIRIRAQVDQTTTNQTAWLEHAPPKPRPTRALRPHPQEIGAMCASKPHANPHP